MIGRPLPGDPAALIFPAGADIGADALPEEAQVCSCNDVSKGQICDAIAEGVYDIASVKACTTAGTSCGGCVPMIKKLLAQSGVEMSKALCEHFVQSRAELFEIVAATGIRTFSGLIARYGTGTGCDICKPTVASILASTSSETHPGRRAGVTAGHQRSLPREHATQRHLFGGAADARRGDAPRSSSS